MPRNLTSSAFMKPFVILALPGMYLFYKYNQYKQQQQEQSKRKVTEKELAQLNHKIDKLLTKLEENEPELATSQEDECVICVNAKATMQTSPCGHRVVCRKCFVKTIQMAVSQRLLPLRCVICRAKILRLKQSSGHGISYSKSWRMPSSASSYSVSAKSWSSCSSKSFWSDKSWFPNSASQYSMNIRNVPNSASMYSMTSGSSTLSGMSSVSSATSSSTTSSKSSSSAGPAARGTLFRQPVGSLRKSQQYSMKIKIQEFNEPRTLEEKHEKPPRLAPIVEFQREYRLGKEKATSSSTRIRCAQKIVTQLETVPIEFEKAKKKSVTSSSSFFKSPLRPSSKEDKKRDKSEDKRKGKTKQEPGKIIVEKIKPEPRDKKSEKKELKVDKKKTKKEATEKKEEITKENKTDKQPFKKDGKNEAAESVNTGTADKNEAAEKETLL